MTFANVKLILVREIRDQLRDRRTLFMIAVLPILLYPLMGISLFQVSQFMQERPTRVLVLGAKNVADLSEKRGQSPFVRSTLRAVPANGDCPLFSDLPPLFEGQQFAAPLFSDPSRARLLTLDFAANDLAASSNTPVDLPAEARRLVQSGKYEAALVFPSNFASRLDSFRAAIRKLPSPSGRGAGGEGRARIAGSENAVRLEVPSPEIIYSTATDKSQITFARLSEVLRRWTEQIADDNLATSGVSPTATRPFVIGSADVSDTTHRGASMWSKILPVLLILWALTGAFYPAVDLCAGEKERGTLETLLCSPAGRDEIVVGKLATIMLFSIATALLNLLSMGLTGWMVTAQLPGFGLPPPTAIAALAVALVPIAALFSALCLALAAFARSTKEGQYYLMPLLLVTMPLVILPMSPGIELNLGTSLIPITGVVLLLRNVLEGTYWQAIQYSPVVAMVTLAACLLSIRWAVEQFNRESVLFRESEHLDLGLWLRHLLRNRRPTPSVAAAACCGLLILTVSFFLSLSAKMPESFGGFARAALVSQLAVIALPALLLTFLLTSSPRQTLLLTWPRWATIPAAALLAVALHPAVNLLRSAVEHVYPVAESVRPALEKLQGLFHGASLWSLVLLLAVVPAVCEELAFRGFILSGFRHLGYKWRAVALSAALFGVTHGILQQSLIASLLGVVLGFLAVQSGSILPGMAFHFANNALALATSRIAPAMIPNSPLLRKFVAPADGGGFVYEWRLILVASLSAVLLLLWFGRLNCHKSAEEQLEEAIDRGSRESLFVISD